MMSGVDRPEARESVRAEVEQMLERRR